MKKSFVLLSVLIPLIINGCAATYTIKDFSSKQEFYNHFNSAVNDRSVKATLLSDTVFTIQNGAEILDDTLYSLKNSYYKNSRRIALEEIKNIKYETSANGSAVVLLKNGDEFPVDDIRSRGDSMEFFEIKRVISRTSIVPVDRLKEIKYKGNEAGIFPGLVSGFCLGIIAGAIGYIYGSVSNNQEDPDMKLYRGSAIGIVSGSIMGFILGINYTYEFNISP